MCNLKKFFCVVWFYVCVCFKKFFDFSGRARRKEYWSFALFTWLIGNLFSLAYSLSGVHFIDTLSIIYAVIILIPSLSVAFRRAHDIGYSGVYVVIGYVITFVAVVAGGFIIALTTARYLHLLGYGLLVLPLLVFLLYVYFFTRDSQPGENKWGANPKEL